MTKIKETSWNTLIFVQARFAAMALILQPHKIATSADRKKRLRLRCLYFENSEVAVALQSLSMGCLYPNLTLAAGKLREAAAEVRFADRFNKN